MNCYWIQNTLTTFAALRKASKGVAVIPLGSIESHGEHLPLGCDPIQGDHIMQRVVKRETVAVLPMLHYSYVGAARSLPGAIHMGVDLVQQMVERICDEVYRNGFDKVVLLHFHGGNVALHWGFTAKMLEADKPYAVYSVPVILSDVEDRYKHLLKCEHQGHACEMETSMSMVACPDLVRLDLLGKKTFKPHPQPKVGHASTPIDFISKWPEMAVGEPQHATRAKGEVIVAAWTDTIVKHLKLIKEDKIVPKEMKRYSGQANGLRAMNQGSQIRRSASRRNKGRA